MQKGKLAKLKAEIKKKKVKLEEAKDDADTGGDDDGSVP